MGYISLYRKYRPQTFEEVVGQIHITRTLSNAAQRGMISHAYLFSGPRGTGKTSVAKILAKAVNCKKGLTPSPCGKCPMCKQITTGSLVDVLEIDAASNRGIDEIRDLREKISFSPTTARYKVYIVDEVHMLTTEAFNALLKILEEPPAHVIFVLATTERHKVPSTILSRCQQFDFRSISVADIADRLGQIATSEKIEVDEASLALIAKHARGSLRDAIGIMDQLASFSSKDVKVDDVVTFLGMVDADSLFEVVEALGKRDTGTLFVLVDKLVKSGRDFTQIAKELMKHLRDLLVFQSLGEDKNHIVDANPQGLARMKAQAQRLSSHQIMQAIDILSDAHSKMRYSTDRRLLLEAALLKITEAEEEPSLERLLGRVEQLEQKIEDRKQKTGNRGQKSEGRSQKSEISASPAGGRNQESEIESHRSNSEPQNSNHESITTNHQLQVSKPATGDEGQEDVNQEPAQEIKLDKVRRAWTVILDEVKKEKISTYALLLESWPSKLEVDILTLEFDERAAFHKGEVEKSINASVVKKALKEVLGVDLDILCIIGKPQQVESQAETPTRKSGTEETEKTAEVKEDAVYSAVELAKNHLGAEVVSEESRRQKRTKRSE